MNIKNHNTMSLVGYAISICWIFFFGVRYLWFYPDFSEVTLFLVIGAIMLTVSVIHSRVEHISNTLSYIEDKLAERWNDG